MPGTRISSGSIWEERAGDATGAISDVFDAVTDAVINIIGHHCRGSRPATTTIVAGLVAPQMKVEIEVTARQSPTER